MSNQKEKEFFRRLYLNAAGKICYADQQGNEREADCDYIVMTSVTIDLNNRKVVCGFDIEQAGSMITRYYPAAHFLIQKSGKTTLVQNLADLGFDLGSITEAELIAFIKDLYRFFRDNPLRTTSHRGWLTYNGARLFITNVAHGENFPCSPRMNPAFAPSPTGSLNAFLAGTNDLIIGHRPTELALSIALGAPLFSLFQDRQSNDAVCIGMVSATSRGKTTLLNYMTAALANSFYTPPDDDCGENEEVLPAKFDLNVTSSFLFGSLNRIRGCACGLDDFTAGIITDIEKVLYQLALGCEKGRANSEGKSKKRNRFSTYFFINAERSLINLETNGGVFRRYLEIRDMDCCKDAVHAEAIAALSRTHYATLGNDYIARLMRLDDKYLSDLSDRAHDKLKQELDSLELKDAKARYALAKSLCYLPAALGLFNVFYAMGENAPCKRIDVGGFIKWLALKIADNTRENAVYFNFAADVQLLKDIVLPRFYCRLSTDPHEVDPISGKEPLPDKTYSYALSEIDFDSYDSLDVYDSADSFKQIGLVSDGKLAIQTGAFVAAYNAYVRACNDNSAVKNRKSCTQFLKEMKLNGVLYHDDGENDKRLTRKITLPESGDLSREVLFGTNRRDILGDRLHVSKRCYVFHLKPDTAGTPDIDTAPDTDNGETGGGV